MPNVKEYAHILDNGCRKNAERFEKAFYTPGEEAAEKKPVESNEVVLMQFLSDPKMVALLKNLVQTL